MSDVRTTGDEEPIDATSALREQLKELRDEAQRVSELTTGTDKVDAAERFADAAGALDERLGAASRSTDGTMG